MTPVLSVRDLRTTFQTRRGAVHAVDRVSFDLFSGETLGLVGESGCGKSTLGRSILRLVDPSAGSIVLDGVDITALDDRQLRPLRSKMQIIFQDPYASLNPRKRVGRIIEEPLIVNARGKTSGERTKRVAWLMERVGLRPEAASRYPHEFSGGQRQRIGIARALALNPRLIVCDEPVSALDVSIRAQVINLLVDIQQEMGLAYLFISHDLSVVEHLSDRVAVMYLGQIVELGLRKEVWSAPRHPYTQALIAAAPIPNVRRTRARQKVVVQGDIPSPLNPPPGCRFSSRCPIAEQRCRSEAPVLRSVGGHLVACHLS